jgi:hypothetical protein
MAAHGPFEETYASITLAGGVVGDEPPARKHVLGESAVRAREQPAVVRE